MADAKELISTEQWLERLDPRTTPGRDGRYLRRVREAADAFEIANAALESTKAQLDDAGAQARIHDDSWGLIGMVLGVSRQAAQQRFAHIDDSDRGQVHPARHRQRH